MEIAIVLLIALPVPILLFTGFQSLKRFIQHAKSTIESSQPVQMSIAKIDEQSLWFNSKHSPGYRINLTPVASSHAPIEGLKIDPSDEPAHQKWQALCKQMSGDDDGSKAPAVSQSADVYFDKENQPVAVAVEGAIAWKAGWFGDS